MQRPHAVTGGIFRSAHELTQPPLPLALPAVTALRPVATVKANNMATTITAVRQLARQVTSRSAALTPAV